MRKSANRRLFRDVSLSLVALMAALGSATAQTFNDRLGSAGLGSNEASQGVTLGDFDGDGHTDIFLPSLFVDLSPIPITAR